MQLADLRKNAQSARDSRLTHGDEQLVVDQRSALKPAEQVSRKLFRLLNRTAGVAAGMRAARR
jgi:hypothetical protein